MLNNVTYFIGALFLFTSQMAHAERILVSLAHPDDELSINGTIHHLVLQGHDVHISYSTSGKYGTHVRMTEQPTPDTLAAIRESEAIAALQALGVPANNVHFLHMDDYASNIYQITPTISQLMTNLQPAIVITFGVEGLYGHVDHRAISTATTYTFNNMANSKVLLYLAVSQSKDQGYGFTHGKGTPITGYNVVHTIADEAINYLVDVSAYTNVKVQSLWNYQSQYLDSDLNLIQSHYQSNSCVMEPVPFSCEQFILGGIKRKLNRDVTDIVGLKNLAN